MTRVFRSALNAPVIYDRSRGGYRYDESGGMFELPGVWFNAGELQALLVTRELLLSLQPGLLETHLAPLKERIDQLLATRKVKASDVVDRVRVLRMAAHDPGPWFTKIAEATINRKRLRIDHYNRVRDEAIEREISPQRLAHYRDNWYLDAWCHLRNGLRTFSLATIRRAQPLKTKAKPVPKRELDDYFGAAYGIFSGEANHRAVLHFSPERARWVRSEQWHPEQVVTDLADGRIELTIPYGDPTELIMDILRHGAQVEVISPASLRAQVETAHREAAQQYA